MTHFSTASRASLMVRDLVRGVKKTKTKKAPRNVFVTAHMYKIKGLVLLTVEVCLFVYEHLLHSSHPTSIHQFIHYLTC